MVSGRKIVEAAVQMSLADISVLLSAVLQPEVNDVRLTTREGSDNHTFWSLMAEKGWLVSQGNPNPSLPFPMIAFSIDPESRKMVHAIAVTCYEGLRQGMTPEEILAFGKGKPDPRLAHI
jgi:hypothetical protein